MKDKRPPIRHFRIADWLKNPPDFSALPKKYPDPDNPAAPPPQLDPGWFEVHQFGLANPSAVVRVVDLSPGRKEVWDFAPLGLPEEYHWPNENDTGAGVSMVFIAITEQAYDTILAGWNFDHPRWIFIGTQVS